VTYGNFVIGFLSVRDCRFGCTHRLTRKPEDPKKRREECACRHAQIDLETVDVWPILCVDIPLQHTFERTPRASLVAQIVVRDPEHMLAGKAMLKQVRTRHVG